MIKGERDMDLLLLNGNRYPAKVPREVVQGNHVTVTELDFPHIYPDVRSTA